MLTALVSIIAFLTANKLFPLQLPDSHASFSTVVLDSEGFPLRAFADKEGIWRYQVSTGQVSPWYIEALLNYEDRFFYQHFGVNPLSLIRASWQWFSSGEVISGGSTLTMQVARILHPHTRTLTGKFSQIFRALQLEHSLSKKEILALYLNYAPFGGTIEGVQAASYQYFQKPASELRRSEAALLAVLPQAPSRLRPDRYPEKARVARDKVLDRLQSYQVWTPQEIKNAKQESIAAWELEPPMVAPILSRRLAQILPAQRVIKTTITRKIQKPLEEYAKNYARSQGEGISAAILVVENSSNSIKAYIGSSDFLDNSRSGQVDMVTAIRSPGSTLKPFLYGLAIDDNLIHSESLMADVPRITRQYRPGNFSRGFSGAVSISEALQRSLNIPFVQLIEAYGEQRFTNRLAHVLQPLQIPDGNASAAVILGGAGSSLERLVSLYSALARDGYVHTLTVTESRKKQQQRRLLSKEAAWITCKTLQGLSVPSGYNFGLSKELRPKIAWKSGTSYDHRDVWAIGVTRDYTIGVWLGRPDSMPMRKKMGASVAGPLLFTAFERVDPDSAVIPKPAGVKQSLICWPDGRSQDSVHTACDEQRLAWTKKGVTPRTLLPENGRLFFKPEHRVLINMDNGLRVNRSCSTNKITSKTITLWPLALESWLPRQYRQSTRMPVYDNNCLIKPIEEHNLRILGAENGQIFHTPANQPLAINLLVEGASGNVNWYLNGKHIFHGNNRLKLEKLWKGENQLLVVDERGAIAQLSLIQI